MKTVWWRHPLALAMYVGVSAQKMGGIVLKNNCGNYVLSHSNYTNVYVKYSKNIDLRTVFSSETIVSCHPN